MTTPKKVSRNKLDGKIHVLGRGLAIYKVKASPYSGCAFAGAACNEKHCPINV
jgi:hypothetical protein